MVELYGPTGAALPAVTVIILASSDAVSATIERVLAQDYANFDCIVVEDEPMVDFARAIAPYRAEQSDRLNILSRKSGRDCDSLDDAWRQATGRYVAIVCSGDSFRTNWLAVCVAFMEANPETIVGYPDWVLTDGQGNVLEEDRVPDYDFCRMVLDAHCIPGPGILIRRSAVSMPSLRNRSFRLADGYEIWLLLGLQGDFIHIPATTALRKDDTSRFKERLAEYRRASVSLFGQEGLPKIVQSWRHCERVDATFVRAMRIAPESAWTAMRLLFLARLISPLATSGGLLPMLATVAFVRAMTVVPKSPSVGIWLLCLAFALAPFATSRKLLPILAKYSGKLTRFGLPTPVCEWIGHVAERSVSPRRKSQ